MPRFLKARGTLGLMRLFKKGPDRLRLKKCLHAVKLPGEGVSIPPGAEKKE